MNDHDVFEKGMMVLLALGIFLTIGALFGVAVSGSNSQDQSNREWCIRNGYKVYKFRKEYDVCIDRDGRLIGPVQ